MNESSTNQPTSNRAWRTWRDAHHDAILYGDETTARTLEDAWETAQQQVPDDGTRTPEELAEARAVVALRIIGEARL